MPMCQRTVLAIIPARGGSKRLPGKNVRDLSGKPLIAWTIEAARSSRIIDRVILSSDSPAIMEVARCFGCEVPFRRPAALATDEATSEDVTLHVLTALDRVYDEIILLQPTSPLRTVSDIDDALVACDRAGASTCVSVTETSKPPFWNYTLDGDGRMQPLIPAMTDLPRSGYPKTYLPNGAIYITRTKAFVQDPRFIRPDTLAYVMPAERSVDIDTAVDWAVAEALLASRPLSGHRTVHGKPS